MKRISCSTISVVLVTLAQLALPSPSVADRMPVERSLNNRAWGYQIVSGSARAGEQFQMFELRAGDCYHDAEWDDCSHDRERTELSVRQTWPYGTDQWVGFSMLVPAGFPTSSIWSTVAQIHHYGGAGFPTADGSIGHPNHMQFSLTRGQLEVAVWYMTQAGPQSTTWPITDTRSLENRWTDIQVRFDTRTANGDLEIWLNGQQVLTIPDTVTVRPESYYFKYGLYRGPVSQWGGTPPTQTIYFDEVRFGSTREAVAVQREAPVD